VYLSKAKPRQHKVKIPIRSITVKLTLCSDKDNICFMGWGNLIYKITNVLKY